ncbi:PLP-dependent aminotransferase family protein [Methylophilus sp. Leaf414]|uniref:aminotransferase-like domain-containing protein n=1 Tax=Methylophilus sp. Leaf414 TaxID=1736371 RepID=UPI0006F7EA0A|nr:PLP-dependent aminotransferase family protein [Methylophilus sp. Leaf414]KQT37843.1 transcriptional regulator [Methylophilus sp. Leaf414]
MPVTPIITVNTSDSVPLVEQVVTGIKNLVEQRVLRAGTRLPSIREFAIQHGISRFTVVDAYDRLVALGYLLSRRGSGFYVASLTQTEEAIPQTTFLERADDVLWLLHNTFRDVPNIIRPGCGWLPSDWLDEKVIQKSLHELSRKPGAFLTGYGDIRGYLPLRQQLAQKNLADIGISLEPQQIIMTNGASHGLDLVARLFIQPGDVVLVDDPGYYTLFGYLKSLGAKLIGVPRLINGPDITVLQKHLETYRPKLFFTNTVLHNPTGTSTSMAIAHQILQLAEKSGLYIVEDDIYGDFHSNHVPRLATLDQLNRVIYVSSYSKTISASLRVGFVACHSELAMRLLDLKLLTGLTSSEINQRVMYQILVEGRYRKHMEKIRSRLEVERGRVISKLEACGLSVYAEPAGGMFVWAQLANEGNAAEIATIAAKQNIMLAPGNLFSPHQAPSSWLRFNVAHCDDERIFEILSTFK